MSRFRDELKWARQKAEAFLRDEGITGLPVDPFAIAASRDIVVRAKPDTTEGVSGMLLRHGDEFGIMYATHIDNEGFQRFSIAHELGHYFLDGHLDQVLDENGVHESRAGFVSADPYELEADNFAVGLLMPSVPFRRALGRLDAGLAAVEQLAILCRTSLTATANRYAELSEDAVAVIISTRGIVDYCFLSESMRSLPDLTWPRKGSPVPANAVTAGISKNPNRVRSAERADAEADVMDWLGGRRSIPITEEAIGLGSYGKTLTVLSSAEIGQDDEEEEDDEDLIESWTPRFRR